jgi:hypothetical protein
MLFVLLLGLVCLQQADRVLGEEIQGSGHNIPTLLNTSSTVTLFYQKLSAGRICMVSIRIPGSSIYPHAVPDLDPKSAELYADPNPDQ